MKKLIPLLIFSLLFGGCGKDDENTSKEMPKVSVERSSAEPQKENITLLPTRFGELPNWFRDDIIMAMPAIKASCQQLLKEKNEYLSNSKLQIPTASYRHACKKLLDSEISTSAELRYFLEKYFTPYLVLDNGNPEGKFTAYYEASIDVSANRSAKYPYPIYGKPRDLIEANLADFDSRLPNHKIYGRIDNNKFIPYYTREEIETGHIPAPVILWAKDAIDANIMQIQGSAVAKLDTGQKIRVGFAAHNGRPFTGIGSILLSEGLIGQGQASMGEIKKWLKKHPKLAEEKLRQNQRFVFHRISDKAAPVGAHNVPLTAKRSLAVDRTYIPLGALLWLDTTGPQKEKIQQLVVAQDIGGAIKGAVRGDFFWGSGSDDVLALAGKMNAAGHYYILLPKTLEVIDGKTQ